MLHPIVGIETDPRSAELNIPSKNGGLWTQVLGHLAIYAMQDQGAQKKTKLSGQSLSLEARRSRTPAQSSSSIALRRVARVVSLSWPQHVSN